MHWSKLRDVRAEDIKVFLGMAEAAAAAAAQAGSPPPHGGLLSSDVLMGTMPSEVKARGKKINFDAFRRDPDRLIAYWRAHELLKKFNEEEYFELCYPKLRS